MAPIVAALGEREWEQHGGTVVRCTHPSGRISVTYVSSTGYKFRSWKQCLTYLEENSPESSLRDFQKHPPTPKRSNSHRVHSASPQDRQKHHSSGNGRTSSRGTKNSVRELESSSPEVEETFRPTLRLSNGTPKILKAISPPSAAPSSPYSPHAIAGRRRNLFDRSPQKKVVSPSTFNGANMPGRKPPQTASPVPPSANLLGKILDLSSDHANNGEAEHIAPKSSKKIKNDPKLTNSRKRPLTDAGRKRIEELQKVAGVLNPNPPPPPSEPVPEAAKESRARSGKGGRHGRAKGRIDDGSDAEVETQLHASKANGERKKPELPLPLQIQRPVKGNLSGRKRALESSSDDDGSANEDQDFDHCANDSDENGSDDKEYVKVEKRVSSRPQRAAAGTNFKEKRIRLDKKEGLIVVKESKTVDDEEVAIVMTAQPGEDQTPQRRLLDFIIHDDDGNHYSVERIDDALPLYISSLVLPNTGVADKEKGVRCDGFGPIVSWWIMGYEKNTPTVCFCTELAEYYCIKPAGAYKKLFNVLFDKAKVCVEVYRSLSRPEGGDPLLPLDELIARVSRSFSKQGGSGQFFNREFIINNGKFVVTQLTALDENAGDHQQLFSGLPALVSLEQEGERRIANYGDSGYPLKNGALTIREGSSVANEDGSSGADSMSDSMNEDERLARQLQEEDDRAFSSKPARRAPASKGKYYIKINETEIANDYPLPAYYTAEEEEMDEYILFDEYVVDYPEDLPHRKIHDWTLYNSDSRFVSLELLPMLRGAETDMEIFGSGIITEDDGSGFCLDTESAEGGSGDAVVSYGNGAHDGIRVYLSAVKEWKIEFGASMLFISFRTDGAWYRLGKPSQQYVKWYEPVLKTARLAVKMITMLKEASRVNRLSLTDVIKNLSNQSKDEPTYISSKVAEVERYVMAHGQIILQQFAEYPDESIKRSAFITGLAVKMEQLSHTKLILTKKKVLLKKGRNLNPRANLCPDGHKRKPMRATTTRLVDRIWSAFYAGSTEAEGGEEVVGAIAETTAKDAEVVEEELVEESDDEESVEVKANVRDTPKKQSICSKATRGNVVQWDDKPSGKTVHNEPVYLKAISNGSEYTAGTAVLVNRDDEDEFSESPPAILLIEYLYESKRYGPMAHGRVLERGWETILGNAANEREVFLTDGCDDVLVEKFSGPVTVEMRQRRWGHQYRKENAEKDEADRNSAKERERKGLTVEYFCRSWYSPERGAFFSLPKDGLALGTGTCKACETRHESQERMEVRILAKDEGFRFHSVEYRINDYLYLDPDTFERTTSDPNEKVLFKGGRNKGLRAFAICQLLSVLNGNGKKGSRLMRIRRFYRPEDVDKMKAYKADIHEVYYSEETSIVDIATARGKCVVRRQVHEVAASEKCAVNHVFFCSCIHDPKTGTVKQLPPSIKLSPGSSLESTTGKSQAKEITAKAKGKGKAIENEPAVETVSESALATLDIFAGCGGLSEGLHQSEVCVTKWVIEYDNPAAEAFKLNHPTAEVFCENCNVILRSIMEVGGNLDDCVSTAEADELSLKFDKDKKLRLPKPGEVDFISGGPPCQGFSGMNRFNQRAWSKVQCEMILSFLSYAEYFRPRYFLLENVRNFVSFNKGQTFRLSLASLLEMGYQVRFGVLQAGNYGVAQSRKRAFIWAAAPGESLPEWPEPRYVFSSSQLGITLPGGIQYAAVRDAARGAPLRPITVRDTVGDLPLVENGASKGDIPYTSLPESWFQVQIRGEQTHLIDHIAKEMNELNTIRCQRIPKEPGADWRCLPEEKVKLSTGQLVDLIPWCLPNTADRHNQWKGLFGRLDWDGNFPTSITDPQPMGKVGMCFHPEQDRIITVRECARSQGFPDSYKFFGNINSKHRQIGNAVPPPLARALGHMLKEAIWGR
ncbi:unnamed protein product [Calypogeia fissa]